MKNKLYITQLKLKSTILMIVCSILFSGSLKSQTAGYYQLKIYCLENDSQLQRMDSFLKQAYLPALHRAGIQLVGVFKPNGPDTAAIKKLWVLIPLKSLEQFEKLPLMLGKDKQFQDAGKDYIDAAFDNAPYKRIESILMKTFKDMPQVGIPTHITSPSERVYELRSYQGATEKYFQKKVEMFNEGGEINLFKELGFDPVFYGEVISGTTMPNLMYMTTFSNEASQKEHWNAFQNHPTWAVLKELEKYKNTVSKIEIFLLHPTEYSDL
jgi:hypothetical protein